MTATQIKNKLIDEISAIEDIELLKAIKKIIDTMNISTSLYKLSDEQRDEVNEGRKEIKKGKYIENSELEKEEDKWLNE